MAIFAEIIENECINERQYLVKSDLHHAVTAERCGISCKSVQYRKSTSDLE